MEVTILKGQLTAKDLNGEVYKIEGIKIIRQQAKMGVFYDTSSPFYLAAAAENTKSNASILPSGKVILLQLTLNPKHNEKI